MIATSIMGLPEWSKAELVLMYMAMRSEVPIGAIMRRALDEGKRVGVPRICGQDLIFHELSGDVENLPVRTFGIREPDSSLPEIDIDFWSRSAPIVTIVPGVAFDRNGNRLGRGRGFYDIFLARHSSALRRVGICLDSAILDIVPAESHDVAMDWVISELRIIRTGPRLDSSVNRM